MDERQITDIVKLVMRETSEVKKQPVSSYITIGKWVGAGTLLTIVIFIFYIGWYSKEYKSAVDAIPHVMEITEANVENIEKIAIWQNIHMEEYSQLHKSVSTVNVGQKNITKVLAHRFGNEIWVVKDGDTFVYISRQVGMKLSDLKKLNPHIEDYGHLEPGQRVYYVLEESL